MYKITKINQSYALIMGGSVPFVFFTRNRKIVFHKNGQTTPLACLKKQAITIENRKVSILTVTERTLLHRQRGKEEIGNRIHPSTSKMVLDLREEQH